MDDLFLTNYSKVSFLEKIKDSLNRCKSFSFSVSFIKKAGLDLLIREMEEALQRGVTGRLITSTYQNFTDIASIDEFLRLMRTYPNFTAHIDYNCFGSDGFHTKGYLFEYEDSYEFIVGSSNITFFALLKNIEWDVSLYSKEMLPSMNSAYIEFESLWERTLLLTEDIKNKYSQVLQFAIEKWDMDYFDPELEMDKPNAMQQKALKELRRNRDLGVKRCLVIAATGSGKTYLAAFDARNYESKRLLYIVHKETILLDAKKTFEKVFGNTRTYGLYTGNQKDKDADFVFATNVMMSKHLDQFDPMEFDYICMDECHHATSNSYRSIMDYFHPGFILGLTATPDRMDNEDVYELFENNVPFELRLRDAINNDLVVPFHYYAIRDTFADYSSEDKRIVAREISKTANIEFICRQIELHKKEGEKLKCIAFCTSIDHARLMAELFVQEGYDALSLTGKNTVGERIKTFHDLQDENESLEIICTVDILNEGVDIPSVNMVLFLRPTESSTIFIQQLGRGLRKFKGKEYVTVLDFIGNNYERSVQIAMALGTLSNTTYLEKGYLKSLVAEDFRSLQIKGVEIFFDDLSKAEVIAHLDNTNFNKSRFLKSDYQNFKSYLNAKTYPKHMDYLNSDCAPNLIRFMKSKISNAKNRSYYTFLKRIGEEDLPLFNDSQVEFIDNVSELLPLVRLDEYLIIRGMLNSRLVLSSLIDLDSKVTNETLNHALEFVLEKKNIVKDGALNVDTISDEFISYMEDLLSYGIERYRKEFGDYTTKFKLMGNYYKEQIQMIKLSKGLMYMKGTEFDTATGETYCYVGLNKDLGQDTRLNYKDKFIDSKTFEWESEVNTTFDSPVGIKIVNTKVVHLFVRKMENEDGITLPFTYFGTGKFKNIRESFTEEKGKKSPTLLMDIVLDNEVSEDYFLDFEIEKKA